MSAVGQRQMDVVFSTLNKREYIDFELTSCLDGDIEFARAIIARSESLTMNFLSFDTRATYDQKVEELRNQGFANKTDSIRDVSKLAREYIEMLQWGV